ncbi:MAG: GntR family transcriptional regulator [Xanthomonadales bacterium]|nr:GntR family transcriptional regulator [Xanthomonadales bacterium]
MVTEQTQKRTMASKLADSVRDDIVNGTHAPGARLNLSSLSKQYQAGINPLREALSRLSTTGFITAEDQRGFRVSEISRKELIDTQRIRIELECLALREAITNGGVVWEGEIIAAHHRMSRIQNTPEGSRLALDPDWETAHSDFHFTLLSGCKSEWLMLFISTLFECSTRYRKAVVLSEGKSIHRNVTKEHQDLMDSVLDKDADKACELLSQHFNETTQFILASMDKLENQAVKHP